MAVPDSVIATRPPGVDRVAEETGKCRIAAIDLHHRCGDRLAHRSSRSLSGRIVAPKSSRETHRPTELPQDGIALG